MKSNACAGPVGPWNCVLSSVVCTGWRLARTVRRIAHCKNRGGPHTHKRHIGEQQNTNVHTQLASVVRGCLVDAHLVTCFSRPALASMECLDEGAALLNRRHLVGLQRIDLRT